MPEEDTMRCENCKYWGLGEFAYQAQYENATAKMCAKIQMLNHHNGSYFYRTSKNPVYDPEVPIEYVYGKNEKGHAVVVRQIMHHKAYCIDGSSYRAELVTRPDFGCVLWEEAGE